MSKRRRSAKGKRSVSRMARAPQDVPSDAFPTNLRPRPSIRDNLRHFQYDVEFTEIHEVKCDCGYRRDCGYMATTAQRTADIHNEKEGHNAKVYSEAAETLTQQVIIKRKQGRRIVDVNNRYTMKTNNVSSL